MSSRQEVTPDAISRGTEARPEGFVQALFRGGFRGEALFPFPEIPRDEMEEARDAAARANAFARAEINPIAIDRDGEIPPGVLAGLGRVGFLGLAAPREFGGRGFSTIAACRVMEVIAEHCGSTAFLVNSRHSACLHALMHFGSATQKARWLPPLCRGEAMGGFAPDAFWAGPDRVGSHFQARLSDDGQNYRLQGTSRFLASATTTKVLIVLARTDDRVGARGEFTAFLVSPDLPGFEVVTSRTPRCGLRGVTSASLELRDVEISATRMLGRVGEGLSIARKTLPLAMVAFGACSIGMSKGRLNVASRLAAAARPTREGFDLVGEPLAHHAARRYAMEAMTTLTAAMIDRGEVDAECGSIILKIYSSDVLRREMPGPGPNWDTVDNDLAIALDLMERDAWTMSTLDGPNDVLKSRLVLSGVQDLVEGWKGTLDGLRSTTRFMAALWRLGGTRFRRVLELPRVSVSSPRLAVDADLLTRGVAEFGRLVDRSILRHGNQLLARRNDHERLADGVIALFAASCALARLDHALTSNTATRAEEATGLLAVRLSRRDFQRALPELGGNDDMLVDRIVEAAVATHVAGR